MAAKTTYRNPVEAYGVRILDAVFKRIQAGTIEAPGADRPTSFNWDRFQPFSQWYSARQSYKTASPDQLLSVFSNESGIKFDGAQKEVLRRAFALIPESLRSVSIDSTDPTKQTSLISFINLLPYLDSVEAAFTQSMPSAEEGESVSKEWLDVIGAITKTKSLIRNHYLNVETQRIQSQPDPAIASRWQEMTEAERAAEVSKIVDAGQEGSPLLRLIPDGELLPQTESKTPTLDQYTSEFDPQSSEDLAPQTYEDYLRLNPESSLYDIAKLESEGALYTDGFEASWFSRWNANDGTVQTKDENGKPVLWKAEQALNLIYDIAEKNPDKLREIQKFLKEGGYYAETFGVPGVLDDSTKLAWASFLTDSARNNLAPKDNLVKRMNERRQLRTSGVEESQFDPAAVRASVQSAAEAVLGRTLGGDEVYQVMQMMKKWEAEALTAGLMSTDSPTVNFDARIAEYISQANNEEVMFNRRLEADQYWKVL